MQNIITGKAYVLGDNVDTDQIIPAAICRLTRPFPKNANSSACTP